MWENVRTWVHKIEVLTYLGLQSGIESACQRRRCKRCGFNRWVRRTPWSRKWQPTPVFLPGESRGQRSLAGYSSLGHKESDTTEWAGSHAYISPPSWTSLPPTHPIPPGCYRIRGWTPCVTQHLPSQLSILHAVMYTFQCCSLSSSTSLSKLFL